MDPNTQNISQSNLEEVDMSNLLKNNYNDEEYQDDNKNDQLEEDTSEGEDNKSDEVEEDNSEDDYDDEYDVYNNIEESTDDNLNKESITVKENIIQSDNSEEDDEEYISSIVVNDEDDDDDDSSSEEEEDEDELYYKKIEQDNKKSILQEYHPEIKQLNTQEMLAMTKILRNNDGVIVDNLHKSLPILTRFEKARIIGLRAKQINMGAEPFIDIPDNIIDGLIIAEMELKAKKIPFIIRRPMPNGGSEYWNIKDLTIL